MPDRNFPAGKAFGARRDVPPGDGTPSRGFDDAGLAVDAAATRLQACMLAGNRRGRRTAHDAPADLASVGGTTS